MLSAGNQHAKPSIWSHAPITTPEVKVWRAVLVQAFEDAEIAANDDAAESDAFERTRARQYLRADNPKEAEHLKLVCDFAEIPADRLISWARKRYSREQATEIPLECGNPTAAFPPEAARVTRTEPSQC
jgi:hypothetical protein